MLVLASVTEERARPGTRHAWRLLSPLHGSLLVDPETHLGLQRWLCIVVEHMGGGEEAKLGSQSGHIWREVGGGGCLKAKLRYGDPETPSKESNSIHRRAQRQVSAPDRLSGTQAVVPYRSAPTDTIAQATAERRHPAQLHPHKRTPVTAAQRPAKEQCAQRWSYPSPGTRNVSSNSHPLPPKSKSQEPHANTVTGASAAHRRKTAESTAARRQKTVHCRYTRGGSDSLQWDAQATDTHFTPSA